MGMIRHGGRLAALIAACWLGMAPARAAEAPTCRLKPGDRLAMLGDSITARRGYAVLLETYLMACAPSNDLECLQIGMDGETACGFTSRMERDLLPWKPTVATISYGKNDGRYRPYDPALADIHEESMRRIVERLKEAGTTVVVGTPGVMDTFHYQNQSVTADAYNRDVLGRLALIDRRIAEQAGQPWADINTLMLDVMRKAKAAEGDSYNLYGGGDSVHPWMNGHLVIAYGFLRALGMDGDIGTITVAWTGAAEATAGHDVLGFSDGVVTMESRRYPFCFTVPTDEASRKAETASVLPFLPFQEDLNRFVLVVRDLPTASVSVKWGDQTKTFSREQLDKGVNLAAEFLDNPFSKPFAAVMRAVNNRQNVDAGSIVHVRDWFDVFQKHLRSDPETTEALAVLRRKREERKAIKQVESPEYRTKRRYLDLDVTIPDRYRKYEEEIAALRNDPEILAAVDVLRPQLLAARKEQGDRVRASVRPVRHAIEIRPVAGN